jgi:PadR family transcriptional regulator, regulatory protein AphA
MSRSDLTPVSYVVLGLVARDGPSTPYALKTAVGRGVAHFWPFPHSQIYAETERLAGLGLLAEEREHTGRRRRSYRITAEGRAALADWLAEPAEELPQFRSLGLLKLFFGQHAGPGNVAELATAQVELHRQVVELTAAIVERLQARPDLPGQLAVAELMGDAYRVMGEHWERVAEAAAGWDGRRAGGGRLGSVAAVRPR